MEFQNVNLHMDFTNERKVQFPKMDSLNKKKWEIHLFTNNWKFRIWLFKSFICTSISLVKEIFWYFQMDCFDALDKTFVHESINESSI